MERFPIENEELLPEDANQVEVYYQEPQDFDTFAMRDRHKRYGSGDLRDLGYGVDEVVLGWGRNSRGEYKQIVKTSSGAIVDRPYTRFPIDTEAEKQIDYWPGSHRD